MLAPLWFLALSYSDAGLVLGQKLELNHCSAPRLRATWLHYWNLFCAQNSARTLQASLYKIGDSGWWVAAADGTCLLVQGLLASILLLLLPLWLPPSHSQPAPFPEDLSIYLPKLPWVGKKWLPDFFLAFLITIQSGTFSKLLWRKCDGKAR